MRNFDYNILPEKLLTPEISSLLSAIHEFRGRQDWYQTAKPDVLDHLMTAAVIESTGSSNRIEGISTSDHRLSELVMKSSEPVNRNEAAIAGYRDVLSLIHENYQYIPISPNFILQLHRDLYAYLASSIGGHWKDSDNLITGSGQDGSRSIRFRPVPAFETPDAVAQLCLAYNHAVQTGRHDPLLLSVLFVFDFLCIHPFNDGNGRISRLLTLLLLYRNGYIVGKYISLERLIEKSRQTYYEALMASSAHWQQGKNDYMPFLCYYLGTILKAYREFAARVEHLVSVHASKTERIHLVFEQRPGRIAKRDIAEFCPDISISMIEQTLKQMLDAGIIRKTGAGKNTAYVSVHSDANTKKKDAQYL